MKITTINLGETQIEFNNSLLGKETIKVNGKIVSSKMSFWGMDHVFKVNENGEEVSYKLTTGRGILGVMINLSRNEKAIIESPKTKGWLRFIIVAILFFYIGTQIADLFIK